MYAIFNLVSSICNSEYMSSKISFKIVVITKITIEYSLYFLEKNHTIIPNMGTVMTSKSLICQQATSFRIGSCKVLVRNIKKLEEHDFTMTHTSQTFNSNTFTLKFPLSDYP